MVQAASSPAPAPQASPLTRYQVPKTSKLPQSQADLAVYVKNLLVQMQTRFQAMSDGIAGRIDELGSRIDELDKSITQLIDQTGMEAAESSPARLAPSPHTA